MKLFKTNNIDVVKTCQQYFNFEMPSTLWKKRCASFDFKFSVPKIFSVKLHRILFKFVLVEQWCVEYCIIACNIVTCSLHLLAVFLLLFVAFHRVYMFVCFLLATTSW